MLLQKPFPILKAQIRTQQSQNLKFNKQTKISITEKTNNRTTLKTDTQFK